MNRQESGTCVICVILVLFLTALDVHATHFYSPSLSELVKESDFVFVGEICKVRRSFFGYKRNIIRMLESIKGDAPSEVIVGYGESWIKSQANVPVLREGERYLFFVVDIDNELFLAGITGPEYYRIDENGEVLCGQEKLPLNECTQKARMLTFNSPQKRLPNKGHEPAGETAVAHERFRGVHRPRCHRSAHPLPQSII